MVAAALLLAATFTRPLERVNSMDPILAQSVYDSRAVLLVYEAPLAIDYAARPYALVPGLCELPQVSYIRLSAKQSNHVELWRIYNT